MEALKILLDFNIAQIARSEVTVKRHVGQ